MDQLSIHYCRVCGSDVAPEEKICTKCGGVQFFGGRENPHRQLVMLLVGGFIAVVLLGVVSAISIPKLSLARTDDCDAVALRNTVAVKLSLESAFAGNGDYPETIEQLHCAIDKGVSVRLINAGGKCTIVVLHMDGNREYRASPGQDRIFSRLRNLPGERFAPVR